MRFRMVRAKSLGSLFLCMPFVLSQPLTGGTFDEENTDKGKARKECKEECEDGDDQIADKQDKKKSKHKVKRSKHHRSNADNQRKVTSDAANRKQPQTKPNHRPPKYPSFLFMREFGGQPWMNMPPRRQGSLQNQNQGVAGHQQTGEVLETLRNIERTMRNIESMMREPKQPMPLQNSSQLLGGFPSPFGHGFGSIFGGGEVPQVPQKHETEGAVEKGRQQAQPGVSENRDVRQFSGELSITFKDDSGMLVLKGNRRDIERVRDVIEQIKMGNRADKPESGRFWERQDRHRGRAPERETGSERGGSSPVEEISPSDKE